METKIIHIEKDLITKELGARERLNKKISEFKRLAESYGLEFSKQLLIDFLSKGENYLTECLRQEIDKDIKRLGVKSEVTKQNLLNGVVESANYVMSFINGIQEECNKTSVSVHTISFNNKNEPFISKEDKKEIEEKYSITLDSDLEEQIWDKMNNLSKALFELVQLQEKNYPQIPVIDPSSTLNDAYVIWKGERPEANPYFFQKSIW